MGAKNDKRPVIGIDLGGTKILAGVVDDGGKVLGTAKRPTKPETGAEAIVDRMARVAREAIEIAGLKIGDLAALGAGVPGPLDPEEGMVISAPNLPGWHNVPLAAMIGERLTLPVFIENDVRLGTLGEFTMGTGRGACDMAGIFIGTGIGGGLILNGKLRQGWRKNAGELGHMILLPDGPVCGCGNRGCLESLASRTAMERDILAGIDAGRASLVPKLMEGEGRGRLTSGVLAEAIRNNDALVCDVMARAQHYLGLAVASIVNLLDLERVILGGGVVEALGDPFLEPIREVAYQNFINKRKARKVLILPAKLGDMAGLLGAAVYARERLARPAGSVSD